MAKPGTLLVLALLLMLFQGCDDDRGGPMGPQDAGGIDSLVAASGVPEDPPPPRPGYSDWEDPTEIDWSHGETWICREGELGLNEHPLDFPLFGALAGVSWPGAALHGNSLRELPDPITAARGGGTIILKTGMSGAALSSVHVETMTHATVQAAVDSLVALREPGDFAADVAFVGGTFRSWGELSIHTRASASFLGLFSAGASFTYDEAERRTWFLITLRQKYYTVVFERPQNAHEFFAPHVTGEDLAAAGVGPGNPPCYVESVSYGRVFYFWISTTDSRSKLEAAVNASFFGLVDGGGEVRDVTGLRDRRIGGYAYGGSAGAALAALQQGWENSSAFFETMASEVDLRFGAPLSFSVRSVNGDRDVRHVLATEYTVEDCYPGLPGLAVSPLTVDFGPVRWGTQKTKYFTLRNTGGISLSLQLDPGRFVGCETWVPPSGAGCYCFRLGQCEVELSAGASVEIPVTYYPRGGMTPCGIMCALPHCGDGSRTGIITVLSEGAPAAEVLLTGCRTD